MLMEGNETINQDTPLMVAENRVKDLERKAIAAYRAAYPDGPLAGFAQRYAS
ncbi:hypothetical protein [Methylomicrobium agile]|jgi:hypothetical protein|uniref:hypothetical protein n=1 Tax=Methylomicrobium agile TaxID=39774 RepID=UPI000A931401|nr:hypothetical protein [Methylomicrobium agile]